MEVGLDLDEQPFLLEVGDDVAATLEAVLSSVRAAQFVDVGRVGHHVGGLQPVADTDFVVGRVVGGGDLHRAGAELRVHRFIRNDRDATANGRQYGGLADEVLPAGVIGVDGDGGIAQDSLRAGGCHLDELGRALSPPSPPPAPLIRGGERGGWPIPIVVEDGVADVPEVTSTLFGDHLQVGDGAGAAGAPVDQICPPVNEALLVEMHERGAHRATQVFIKGKPFPRPIAGDTEPFVLFGNTPLGFPRPGPATPDELLAPQVVACEALLG